MYKVYLDACCLNRPFDDQSFARIHLESEAIQLILYYFWRESIELITSEVLDYEIGNMEDENKKNLIRVLVKNYSKKVQLNDVILNRALQFQVSNIPGIDSLHIACAEHGKADYFLTTDDILLKRTSKIKRKLKVAVYNPLQWIQEVKFI